MSYDVRDACRTCASRSSIVSVSEPARDRNGRLISLMHFTRIVFASFDWLYEVCRSENKVLLSKFITLSCGWFTCKNYPAKLVYFQKFWLLIRFCFFHLRLTELQRYVILITFTEHPCCFLEK